MFHKCLVPTERSVYVFCVFFSLSALSSPCGEFWTFEKAVVHKASLNDVGLRSLMDWLSMSSVIEPLEHTELSALADRWSPWNVKRRLACMVSWKPAKEQMVFVQTLGRMASTLEAERSTKVSHELGEKEV